MGHNHNHSHHHSFNRAFAIAITLTLAYTFLEAAYAIVAHSMSLLADALHNLGDSLGLLLAWLANWLLSFPARKRYSYGYKRTTIFAALANAFLLVATSMVIAYESIRKLFHLMDVNEHIVIIVGLLGIIVNIGCSLLFMRGAKEDLNIKGAFLHLMADALILAGVVFSAIIIAYTGWDWIDPIVGLIIVGIVLWGTWGLMRDSLALMMDAVPRYINYNEVTQYLKNYPSVAGVHDVHIWGLSTREVALTAHLTMPDQRLSDQDIRSINLHLKEKFSIHHVTLQIEAGEDGINCHLKYGC